jgi:hypothetical protein
MYAALDELSHFLAVRLTDSGPTAGDAHDFSIAQT